jgi:four helix bundle protein
MAFGHEKLDVYRAAIEYVGWTYRFCESLTGHRNAKDQLLRASQSIPLNIAEGNGKGSDGDRRRYFEIARGSALECGAVQDVLHATYLGRQPLSGSGPKSTRKQGIRPR